jgi:opacity protein-like surface antigen
MLHILFRSTITFMIGLSAILPAFSYANFFSDPCWNVMVSIGAGAAITSNAGCSQSFPIENPVTDEFYTYTAHKTTQTQAIFDVFLGAEWHATPCWRLQFGVDYITPAFFTAKGSLIQGADVQSENSYAYQYLMKTQQLYFEGKCIYTDLCYFSPYLFMGLGAAFNKAYRFSTTVPDTITFTRIYKDHTNTSFSYAVGAGIDFEIFSNIHLDVCYRFANMGRVALGSATIDDIPVKGTLTQSHLYANQVLAQITATF